MGNIEWMMDMLTDCEIATMEEIALVTAINGTNEETLCNILYVRTGYRSFEQFMEMFEED